MTKEKIEKKDKDNFWIWYILLWLLLLTSYWFRDTIVFGLPLPNFIIFIICMLGIVFMFLMFLVLVAIGVDPFGVK